MRGTIAKVCCFISASKKYRRLDINNKYAKVIQSAMFEVYKCLCVASEREFKRKRRVERDDIIILDYLFV